MLIGPLWTNFSEISIKIHTFSLGRYIWKCHIWKMVAILSQRNCIKVHFGETKQWQHLERISVKYRSVFLNYPIINSVWPSGAILWQRSGSTLAQVMACCLTAPSQYLNQCWQIIILWHIPESNLIRTGCQSSMRSSDNHLRAIW